MYLEIRLTFLSPWHGIQMRGEERGFVGVMPKQSEFKDVLPSSFKGPTFCRVLMKLVAGFDPSVSFPWASERVGIRTWGECLRDGQSRDPEA